jgi:nitrate/nitrite transport system ATP-binding protein
MEIQNDQGNTVIMITHDVDEAVLLSDRIVMMTNGPSATIGEIVDVTLPRPRDRLELADNSEFMKIRQQVLKFLYAKQKFPSASNKAKPSTRKVEAA